ASAAALLIAMTSSEVPTATGMSKLRASTSAGTMTNPPPTPKKPVSRPAPVAAAAIFRPWRTAAVPPGRCQAADEAGRPHGSRRLVQGGGDGPAPQWG